MNKKLFFFFILFFCIHLIQAQKWQSDFESYDIYYGTKLISKGDFYRQLNTVDSFSINSPITFIGFGSVSHYTSNRIWGQSAHFSYCHILPQPVLIVDSIQTKISGFSLGMTLAGIDLLGFSKSIDLLLNLGFNTGRLRLYGNEWVRQKNPFFCPKVSLLPRIKLGKLVITARAEYEYDVSKSGWRRTRFANEDKINLTRLKQTGFTALVGIGFVVK